RRRRRHRRRAEFLDRRRPVRGDRRPGREALRAASGFLGVSPRGASRGEKGRAIRHRAPVEEDDGAGGVLAADRRLVDARRVHPGHAHRGVRRSGRNDHAVARGPRSHGLRPRRAPRGEVDSRKTRLVHNEGRARSSIMRKPFTGVGTAVVTPFTKSGELDEAAVRRLGRRQIDAGVHFLCPCGTTGENPTLSDAERLRIVEILADESAGKIPVLGGAGGYDTKEVIHLAAAMAKRGASGFLSVTPYYNKPTPEGLHQ